MLLNPDDADDAVKIMRRMISGSLEDGVATYGWFRGNVYSHLPWERDRLLYSFHIVSVTSTKTICLERNGYKYKALHKEGLLYYWRDHSLLEESMDRQGV